MTELNPKGITENIALDSPSAARHVSDSQVRLGDVQYRLPRIKALVDERIEILRNPELRENLIQWWIHPGHLVHLLLSFVEGCDRSFRLIVKISGGGSAFEWLSSRSSCRDSRIDGG